MSAVCIGEDVVIACGARSTLHAYELASGQRRWALPFDGAIEAVGENHANLARASDGGYEVREWFAGEECGGGTDLLGFVVNRVIHVHSLVKVRK